MASQSYTNVEVIVKAIEVMSNETEGTTEDKVGRYMTGICSHYFPVAEGWTIVPESRTPDKKIPDLVVERLTYNKFVPHIYVELKSKVSSSSMPKAIKQLATAVFLQFGDGDVNEGFLVVVRGSKIAFLEYIAYFDQDEKKHYCRTIPFNRPYLRSPPDRPTYKGEARYKFPDSTQDTYVLDVAVDDLKVHEVITWMKRNNARDIFDFVDNGGHRRSTMTSRVTSAQGIHDGDYADFPMFSRVNSLQGSEGLQQGVRNIAGPSPVPAILSGNLEVKKRGRGKNTQHPDSDPLCAFQYMGEGGKAAEGVLYGYSGYRSFSMMEEDDDHDDEDDDDDVQMS